MIDRRRLAIGMDVVGSDGAYIGRVKVVRDRDLLVGRRLKRDVYVPFTLVETVLERVVLTYPADAIDALHLPKPSIIRTEGQAAGEPPPADLVTGLGDPAKRGTWAAAADAYDTDPAEPMPSSESEPDAAKEHTPPRAYVAEESTPPACFGG